MHTSETSFLADGYTLLPKGTGLFTRLASNAASGRVLPFAKFPPCRSNVVTEKDCILHDAIKTRILHTPGHTAGSVSFIVDDELALVGDTMTNAANMNIYPAFADSPKLMPDSWKQLLNTKCRLFLPAHGMEISRNLLNREYFKGRIGWSEKET